MASTSQKPKKGILKHSGSIDHGKKEIEWDEMNILATYHPPDKDYGHMKVEEPPTPYNRAAISDSEDDPTQERKGSIASVGELDPDQLALRLEFSGGESDADKQYYQDDDDDDDDADHENETEEERKRRKAFLLKRKMHYNEFAAVQLAKKLMAEDEEEDDKTPDSSSSSTKVEAGKGAAVSSAKVENSLAHVSGDEGSRESGSK
jgi:protein phosphatase inhibitor 2